MDSESMTGGAEGLMVGLAVGFVVLHHTGVEKPHYDLMVDVAGRERLLTWRVESEPSGWTEEPPLAERIGDHRREYLTYEGAVSGNRGEVKRVAEGKGRVLKVTPEILRLYLDAPLKVTLDLPLYREP